MKKLILILMVMLLSTSISHAALDLGGIVEKLPMKQGVAYSFEDSAFNYLSTIELLNYKNITLEAGYAGIADNTNHKLVGVISYPIVKLDQFVDVPVLDLIELNLGIYGGVGQINLKDGQGDGDNEFDWGVSCTLINLKF